MKEEIKLYNLMLETGDLFELLPLAVGEWEQDKKLFLDYYEEVEENIKHCEVDLHFNDEMDDD